MGGARVADYLVLSEEGDEVALLEWLVCASKQSSVLVMLPDILEGRAKPVALATHERFRLFIERTHVIE